MASAGVIGAIAAIKEARAEADDWLTVEERASVGESLQNLETDMTAIQDILRYGDSCGHQKPREVSEVLRMIEYLACEVQDRMESFVLLMSSKNSVMDHWCFGGRKVGILRRRPAAKNLAYESTRLLTKSYGIVSLAQQSVTSGWFTREGYQSRSEETLQRSRSFFHRWVKGTPPGGTHLQELTKRLADNLRHDPSAEAVVISIFGMAGVGKTTLAMKVFESAKRHYDCSAKLHVSDLSRAELLRDLAYQLGMIEEEAEQQELIQQEGEDDLESKLAAYLAEKRYLILFDDICNSNKLSSSSSLSSSIWDSLASIVCIPDHNREETRTRRRIICTSRNSQALVVPPTGWVSFIYELKPLDRPESTFLFLNLVNGPLSAASSWNISFEVQYRAIVSVEACGGLPLAIESLADFFRSNATNEDEWLRLVVRGPLTWSGAIPRSHEFLSLGLQSCFLYPELHSQKEYDLAASDIINRWTAEGLIRAAQGKRGEEPEDIGEEYINHLAANGMILVSSRRFDGRIRTFRVSETVRSISDGAVGEIKSFYKGRRRHCATVSTRSDIIHLLSYGPRVSMESDAEAMEEFCKYYNLQRVLVVEDSGLLQSCLTKGSSIRHLKILRYLGSRDKCWPPAQVKLPSTLGVSLKRLMTLDFRNVDYFEEIPDGIWKLEQLRHLLLRKLSAFNLSRIDIKGAEVISRKKIDVNLPNLLTLYVVPGPLLLPGMLKTSPKLRKLGIDCATDNLIELLSNADHPISNELENLRLRCQPIKGTAAAVNLSRYLNLRRLHLSTPTVPKHVELPPNLVKLVLVLSNVKEDPMQSLSKLAKLRILKLYIDKCSIDCIACSGGPDEFPDLEVLELYLPFYLRKFTVGENAMPKLKKISGLSSQMLSRVPQRIKALAASKRIPKTKLLQ